MNYFLKISAINSKLRSQGDEIRAARYYNRPISVTEEWFEYAAKWDDDYPLLNLIPSDAYSNFINGVDHITDYLQLLRITKTQNTVYCQLHFIGDEKWMLQVAPEIMHRHYNLYR